MLSTYAQDFLDRIKDGVADSAAIGRLSGWIAKHTRLGGRPFSYKDHEFQIDILDSVHPEQVAIKPSQMGLTEIQIRLCLAFLAVSRSVTAIYAMPALHEALRLSKSRIDPVIRESKSLRSQVVAGSDSAGFKQLGTNQLFMMGTYGKAIISVPADLLIKDENDFCNQEVLATAESRMSHSKFKFPEQNTRGFRKTFSTPTVPGYGVSDLFDRSNRLYRLVRCKHCGHWFWPNFLIHCVVSGYDRSFEELTYHDVAMLESRGLLDTARLLCESCHTILRMVDLGPEHRAWVAERPTVTSVEGWQVSPFDLPTYHSPTSLLIKLGKFKENIGHFRNFTLGLPYADASNGVMPNAVRDHTTLSVVLPEGATHSGVYGCVAGLDVGLTSWLTIGYPKANGVDVIWAEAIRIHADRPDTLYDTVIERLLQFGVVTLVCDNLPYTDTILRIQARMPAGVVLPCTYTLPDKALEMYEVNDRHHTVAANRTKTLDYLVKRINSGQFKFAPFPELPTMTAHLQGMKRIDRVLDDGELESKWVKSGPADHYFHSLNYLNIAAGKAIPITGVIWVPPVRVHTPVPGRKFVPDPSEQRLLVK